MGSCCRTAATDYASIMGKSLHSCCRRTGGQEPADPFVLLRGGRERPFWGFSESVSDDAHCDWFSLSMVFFFFFLSVCLHLNLDLMKLALSFGV